jgi:hypothetical protein
LVIEHQNITIVELKVADVSFIKIPIFAGKPKFYHWQKILSVSLEVTDMC